MTTTFAPCAGCHSLTRCLTEKGGSCLLRQSVGASPTMFPSGPERHDEEPRHIYTSGIEESPLCARKGVGGSCTTRSHCNNTRHCSALPGLL